MTWFTMSFCVFGEPQLATGAGLIDAVLSCYDELINATRQEFRTSRIKICCGFIETCVKQIETNAASLQAEKDWNQNCVVSGK